MKKCILRMLLSICIACTLWPVTAQAGANDHADKVKVAGTELTATGYYDVEALGTKLDAAPTTPGAKGYVHWESETGILTLYGATLDGGNSSGIYANQNYTIILSDNTVNNVTSGVTNAITSDGSVTIKGNGTLNATGATNGIRASYTVSITGGATVDVTGTAERGIYISYRYSYWDGLRIENDAASVTITGKTYGVGYENTSTMLPPEIKCPNVTVKGETAAFQIVPTLGTGITAKASSNMDGSTPETYNSASFSSYKWFRSEALPNVSVTGVAVAPASHTINVGESYTLTATVEPDNATNKTVAWTSSDSAVAIVDANGKVTAVAAGSATITATTADGSFTDTCDVTVAVGAATNYDVWVSGVRVNSDNAQSITGAGISGTVSYDHTTKTLTLNNAVITSDNNAAKKEGIYADHDLKIVLQGENSVTDSGSSNAILAIGTLTFEGNGTLNTTSNRYSIQAHGGDIVISGVTVTATGTGDNSRGIVAFENAGTGGNITISAATVTATGETYGICASKDITVTNSTVTAKSISRRDGVSAHSIDGGNITITDSTVIATAECTNWGSYGISGTSYNGCKITIIDSTVTAKAVSTASSATCNALSMAPVFGDSPDWYQWTTTEGGALTKSTDTPYTYNGSHTYLKIEPVIVPAAIRVTGVTVAPASLALTEGNSSMLTVIITPDNADNKTVTWTSSDPAVATVDADGKVTAVAAGSAIITVTTEDGGFSAACAVTVTEAAPTKYTLTVENGAGDGSYAADERISVIADAAPDGKVFDKWVSDNGGTFADANGTSTTFIMPANDATVTATYKDMPGEPDFVTNTQINHDFKDSDIPQGLISETGLDTVAKIDARLKEEIKAKDSSFVNAVVQDVELVYSTDSGVTWTKGDRTHFPADGKLQVSLPVPDGTDPAKHDYIVLHMFTTSDFGKTPGDVERCEYTVRKDTDGKYCLDFYVTGLSPIIVGWKDKVSVPTPTPTPTPEPTPDPTLEPTPTPAPSFAALDEVPPTGDDLSTGLWIILMSISLAGMLAVLLRWKIRC